MGLSKPLTVAELSALIVEKFAGYASIKKPLVIKDAESMPVIECGYRKLEFHGQPYYLMTDAEKRKAIETFNSLEVDQVNIVLQKGRGPMTVSQLWLRGAFEKYEATLPEICKVKEYSINPLWSKE